MTIGAGGKHLTLSLRCTPRKKRTERQQPSVLRRSTCGGNRTSFLI